MFSGHFNKKISKIVIVNCRGNLIYPIKQLIIKLTKITSPSFSRSMQSQPLDFNIYLETIYLFSFLFFFSL